MKWLNDSTVACRLPAQDLQRARQFYAEKLGLEPIEERPGGLKYRCGNAYFALFESLGAPTGKHTQMGWEVEDINAVVTQLRERGVVFEEYDLAGLKTIHGIAEVVGNYPSSGGIGERAAWFRDSEGNLLGIGQPMLKNNHQHPLMRVCPNDGKLCCPIEWPKVKQLLSDKWSLKTTH